MIDDPPTVLRLRVPGRPGRVWVLDCRNWGIEPDREFASADEEARWLADAMRRMVDFLAAKGWGGLKATAGSQSLATWRRKYMTHKVVAHGDDDVLQLEEEGYVGGRCECSRLGPVAGPLVSIDRRSAYAHACATVAVPVRVGARLDGELPALRGSHSLAMRCLAEVLIDTDEPAYPRARPGAVTYPVGRVRTVLAGPELADAVERGRVKWVGRCVEYVCEPALAAYAQSLWDARSECQARGDPTLAALVKRLLVGLPGKLGQRCAEWVPCPGLYPPADWCAWWGIGADRLPWRYRSLGGAVQRQERGGWTYDAVPAAACWVLSAARVELLRAVRLAGWSECVYWDTDSLLLTAAGWRALGAAPGLCGDGLGQWRVVREVAHAHIHGVKHYEHDGALTCAGMPRADQAASRLADRYWYRQTFGLALMEGQAPAAARRLVRYKRVPRYTLGRVGDGGRVHPHVANDW